MTIAELINKYSPMIAKDPISAQRWLRIFGVALLETVRDNAPGEIRTCGHGEQEVVYRLEEAIDKALEELRK